MKQSKDEYLEMDPAGSLAIDQQRVKRLQVYYNTNVEPVTKPTMAGNSSSRIIKEKLMSLPSLTKSSCISPSLLRKKKIISGRIVKKYRISSQSVVHSIQQVQQYSLKEFGSDVYPAERFSLARDQIFADIRHSY